MEYQNKNVRRIDMVMLAVTALAIALLGFLMTGVFFAGQQAALSDVLFSFRSGGVILIDENAQFKSPVQIVANDSLVINMRKGVYYWKIADSVPEDIVQFNITTSVATLKLKKYDGGYLVVNAGNSTLNVDIFSKGSLTGNVVLGMDEGEVSSVIEIGGQND